MAAQRRKLAGGPAGDTGEADPKVTAALTNWQHGAGSEHDALRALAGARFLVPVVAILTVQDQETKAEKESEMALPTLIGNDGRAAIIAFTGVETMKRWRPDARPVVTPAARVWHAAVAESQAVVIDVAGPSPFVVEGARLASLAQGKQPPFPHEDSDIRAVIAAAVAAEPAITGYILAPGGGSAGSSSANGGGADLAVTLRLADAIAAEPARRAAQAIAAALAPRLRRGVELSMELPASR
ncbi:MAG: hypothetical protein JWM19_5762 [Actinomycetia bacterium]|nr:hypothetical protein [Actinomycetes bacterium]